MEQDKEKQEKNYELSFLSQEEGGKEVLLQWINRFGGEVLVQGPVENIVLAYPIAKQSSAHFGFVHFKMSPEQASALSRELKMAGVFLRFLLTTPPCVKTRPRSISAKSKPEQGTVAPIVSPERRPVTESISNEDLEKKIEEILQQQ